MTATGAGKTFASAFAAREFGFKRVLFLVHRNQIVGQAMKAYKKVFGNSVSMGMLTGKSQNYDADFVFATVQTMSKEEYLRKFSPDTWDLIIIDEAHHSSANSYKKIIDYFCPQLWLGMTAMPEVSASFEKMLRNPDFYHILEELVDFGIMRYKENYSARYQDTDLVLYQKYTYEDACRLLNWERNEVPLNIGGYKYDKKTKTFPVIINYDKHEGISDTINYEDHFLSYNRLIAISKSGRTADSEDVQNFIHAKERGIDVQLFVRKNKDDKVSKEFYYLGRMTAAPGVAPKEFLMPNTDKIAVELEWELDTPVREDIYEYIVNG